MKKIIMFLISLLIIPITVNASEYKITNHLIDSEIEIAGGLNVKELIVVEGETDHITRTINNYSFDGGKWDGSTVNLDNGTIYNSEKIVNLQVSAFKITGKVDFTSFSNNIKGFFEEQDPKNLKTTEVYTLNKKSGEETINIFYPAKQGEKIGYYLEYVVSNAVVKHEDIKELNYTFKNLKMDAESTMIRLLIPYATNDDLYHIWVHGTQKAKVEEILNSSKQRAGVFGEFPSSASSVNFRVTLPSEQVGMDVYLNNSKQKALDEIIAIENKKEDKTKASNKINKNMIYVFYGFGILLLLASFILLKYKSNMLFIILSLFGLFIMLFNYLFGYNSIYLYFVLVPPVALKCITLFQNKKTHKKHK